MALTKGQLYYKKNRAQELKRTLEYSKTPKGREVQRRGRAKYRASPKGRCAHLIAAAKARAKKSSISFDLTREWCKQALSQGCALTGIAFVLDASGGMCSYAPSIDRVDPAGGYTQDNCRVILWGLNAFKGTGTDGNMLHIARALVKTQERKV